MLDSTQPGKGSKPIEVAYFLLLTEHEESKKQIEALNEKVSELQEEIVHLKERLQLMQHRQFGKKSERNLGEPMGDPNQDSQIVSSYTRTKGIKHRGRTIDTSQLFRHRFYHDLREDQQFCKECTKPLSKMGEELSEQIEILPQRLYVAEHIRYKYTCRQCQTIIMAPKPKAPIPKALAGGSLITEIIINKYQYHLPLYRQSKILASYHATIPDNTLAQWVTQSGAGLELVYQAYWETVLEASYLQVDETPIKILKPEKKGYLWTYLAPHVGKGLVVFELSLSRSGKVAEKRLTRFKGLLQTDAYCGYVNLRKREDITGFGCMSHSRRKFDEVLKITKNSAGIASEVIERLKPVYALESKMRHMKLNFHARKRLRQKQTWPLLKSLRTWLKQQLPKVPANSKLAKAICYMLTQWPYLIKYLRHGCVEIDTNWVENKERPAALGRRNWLFMGNEDSGAIHALWYSFVLSAIMNGLNPRVYVHYLLSKIHDLRMGTVDPKSLLPHTINLSQLQAFANEQIVLAKEVLNSS